MISLCDRIRKQFKTGKPRIAASTIQTPETPFARRVLIEVGRGCGRSCRFCAAGYVYRPPRTHPEETLLSTVGETLKANDRVGLLSAAITDTPGIEHVMGLIFDKRAGFSVSSVIAGLTFGFASLQDRTNKAQENVYKERLKLVNEYQKCLKKAGSDKAAIETCDPYLKAADALK